MAKMMGEYLSNQERLREEVASCGPWTTNLHLGADVYTIDAKTPVVHVKLVRFGQIAQDLIGRPLSELRVLDLACLEGEYAIEFARKGAAFVLGIEGRAENVARAQLAKRALGLGNLRFVQDDVRNLSAAKHGTFDVVICSGILYHLDAADVVSFLERVGEVCTGCAIVDTHVSLFGGKSFEYKGERFHGNTFIEHYAGAPEEEQNRSSWASIGNAKSFWLTRASLYNALALARFTSVFECHVPVYPDLQMDRITLAAMKGRRYIPADGPAALPERTSERGGASLTYFARTYSRRLLRAALARLPYRAISLLRKVLHRGTPPH